MSRRGFTVVEALIGIVVALLVIGLAVALLSNAGRSLVRAAERQDPREAAHHALAALRVGLADAWAVAVAEDGRTLRFRTPRGDGEARLNGDRLEVRLPSAAKPVVSVPSVVAFVATSETPGLIRVGLELARPPAGHGLASLGPLRVSDEIYIASLVRRERGLPWIPRLEDPRAGASF